MAWGRVVVEVATAAFDAQARQTVAMELATAIHHSRNEGRVEACAELRPTGTEDIQLKGSRHAVASPCSTRLPPLVEVRPQMGLSGTSRGTSSTPVVQVFDVPVPQTTEEVDEVPIVSVLGVDVPVPQVGVQLVQLPCAPTVKFTTSLSHRSWEIRSSAANC